MINRYDAGEINGTLSPIQISLSRKEARHVLIYPKVDCYVSFDGNDKEIFIPANSWTPISIEVTTFKIRVVKDTGKVYWQAWYV